MPGCPELAACTASIESARIALASSVVSSVDGAGEGMAFDAASGAVMVGIVVGREERAGARQRRAARCKRLRQSGKIIAQASNLGNNSEFSR
jgi:hypothetical protein